MKRIFVAPALLCLCLLSGVAQAESFRATVKLKLVAPSSVESEEYTRQTISIPVKQLSNSSCTIDAKSGSTQGESCVEPSIDTPVIGINGRAAQDISVKLSESSAQETSGLAGLSFEPSLYNGHNQEENFQLNTHSHDIRIGGTIFQHELANKALSSKQALQYGIEVLYP